MAALIMAGAGVEVGSAQAIRAHDSQASPGRSGADAALAWKRCGKIAAEPRGRFLVRKKGNVTCRGARKLMNLFLNEGQGEERGGPYGYQKYWTLYGWKCGTGAGGGGCLRRGARTQAIWVRG